MREFIPEPESEVDDDGDMSLLSQYSLFVVGIMICLGLWLVFQHVPETGEVLPDSAKEFLKEIIKPVPTDGTG